MEYNLFESLSVPKSISHFFIRIHGAGEIGQWRKKLWKTIINAVTKYAIAPSRARRNIATTTAAKQRSRIYLRSHAIVAALVANSLSVGLTGQVTAAVMTVGWMLRCFEHAFSTRRHISPSIKL